MRVLIYKRTHDGDPDEHGVFGAQDCMRMVRKREVDAVIGIGGIGREPRRNNLDGRLNWIGIGPQKTSGPPEWKGPLITFEHFIDFGTEGPELGAIAPALVKRFYDRNTRVMSEGFEAEERADITRILKLAVNAPPSPGLVQSDRVIRERCKRKHRSRQC